jgi:DNA-binding HxlR family transcriptional regulator
VKKRTSTEPDISCPIYRFCAIFESKWAIIVLRDLLLNGEQRFSELRRKNPKITDRALTQTLKHLQDLKLVDRIVLDTAPPGVSYKLSPLCKDMGPVFQSMMDWGKTQGQKWWSALQKKQPLYGPVRE